MIFYLIYAILLIFDIFNNKLKNMNLFKLSFAIFLCFICFFATIQKTSAEEIYYQVITLNPGWNVISTPRIVESHQFSATSTSSNFDIYVLDNNKASGWSTMSEIGQIEFTPMYGYFINNKTGSNQSLTLNYKTNVSPNERLFAKQITPGWNIIGIANPDYALEQKSTSADTNNIKKILASASSCVVSVLDFTSDQTEKYSVKVGNTWSQKVWADADQLNDFRETKAYAVYSVGNCTYQGYQNNNGIGSPLITISFDSIASTSVKMNSTNNVFARILLKSDNEDVNIENFRLQLVTSAASSTATLNNVILVDSGNSALYTTIDPTGFVTENLDFENVYLEKGVQYTFDVKGDIPDAAGLTGFTYQVNFNAIGTTGRYVTSNKTIVPSDFSSTTITGNIFTISEPPSIKFDIVPTNAATYVKSTRGALLYNGKITAFVSNQKVSRIQFTVSTTTTLFMDRMYLYKTVGGVETLLDDETSLSGTTVTFSGFSLDIPSGIANTVKYVVRGDIKSQPTGTTGTWTVAPNSDASTFTVRDTDNNTIPASSITVVSTAGPAISIISLGIFTLAVDNLEPGTNSDKNGLAGTTVTIGRFKITAAKEIAILKQLAIYNTGSANDSSVGALKLYKGSVADANLVSSTGLATSKYALFENINAEIPTTGSNYFYVTAFLKNVDYSSSPSSYATAIATSTISFVATSTGSTMVTKVEGKMTGELETVPDLTGATSMKITTLMPAMISNITTTFANSALSNDIKDIFSFKVTAPSTGGLENTDYDGTNLGFKLASTTFTISSSSGITLSSFKIRRVGGSGEKTAAISIDNGNFIIGFQNTYGTDYDLIVKPGETAEYIITATVAGVSTSGESLQVTIENIDNNMKYTFNTGFNGVDGVDSVEFSPGITGITNIRGGSLTN